MTSEAVKKAIAVADAATLYLALTVLAIIMLSSSRQHDSGGFDEDAVHGTQQLATGSRPCDEIYVVGEGETLHTISDKCGDPFVVERNPHVNDPDVFPGLVLSITPSGPNYR